MALYQLLTPYNVDDVDSMRIPMKSMGSKNKITRELQELPNVKDNITVISDTGCGLNLRPIAVHKLPFKRLTECKMIRRLPQEIYVW